MFWGKKKREEQSKMEWPKHLKVELVDVPLNGGEVRKQEFDNFDDLFAYTQKIIREAMTKAPPPEEQPCDVFLCHNSKEKSMVLVIGEKLKARGIVPWIDSERIVGGATYDEVIKQAIIESRSAAIFVGPIGFGRYQQYEVRAFIEACMSNKLKVIPVLLPGCDDLPESEIFLRQHHYVNFSQIDDQDALEQLVKAIRTA